MKVTTSRDPSDRARRLGRTLARFLSVPYVTRGKQSLSGDEAWIVVVEGHGSPNGLVKRMGENEEVLNFKVSSDLIAKPMKPVRPVAVGDRRIAKFFEIDLLEEPGASRVIKAEGGRLEFLDCGDLILGLEIS
jgi:rRNA maturation protein Rpf1